MLLDFSSGSNECEPVSLCHGGWVKVSKMRIKSYLESHNLKFQSSNFNEKQLVISKARNIPAQIQKEN